MAFGSNLERIRKDRKISQANLGKALGLTQQMISSYEKNLSSPNVEVLIKIADYFNVSIDSLVEHVVQDPNADSLEAKFLRSFEQFSEQDKERCLTIALTLIEDKKISYELKK